MLYLGIERRTDRKRGTIYCEKTICFAFFDPVPGRPETGVEKSVKVIRASLLSQRFFDYLWDFSPGPPRCKKSADFEPSVPSIGTLKAMLEGSAGNI